MSCNNHVQNEQFIRNIYLCPENPHENTLGTYKETASSHWT